MKYILLLPMVLLSAWACYAQETHQPPAPMTFSHDSLILKNEPLKFLYSWNWSNAPRALNIRYKMNGYHTREPFNDDWGTPDDHVLSPTVSHNLMPDSVEFIWSPAHIIHAYQPLDAMSVLWYPWLPPSASDESFNGFRNDKTGASLPFLYRNDTLGSLDSASVDSQTVYRWRLNKDTSVTGTVSAFSKPWLGNEFVYRSGNMGF